LTNVRTNSPLGVGGKKATSR